jgi:sugar lactone lactonase YvrE
MRKLSVVVLLIAAALAAYLLLWPVPVRPVVWDAPAAPGYVGPHAVNTRLANLNQIITAGETGPEHIALGPDGKLYAAMASGNLLRMNADGTAQEVFVSTGGRVLGFDFDAAGNIIAADAMRGLLSISPAKQITVLADKVATGDPILYADGVVVAKSGKIYFTDASRRFGAKQWGGTFEASVLDILEQSATGRVLEYDPANKAVRVVFQDLSFANGIALSADETQLFVAETGRYRVWKVALAADQLSAKNPGAQASVVLQNLPGYPDNLMRGKGNENGTKLWLGFAKPRGAAIDNMASKPWLRKLTLRLPRALWPVPPAYGHVIAFDENGRVLADLQDPSGAYPESTGVTETADRLYIQSLHAKHIGWMVKPNF